MKTKEDRNERKQDKRTKSERGERSEPRSESQHGHAHACRNDDICEQVSLSEMR